MRRSRTQSFRRLTPDDPQLDVSSLIDVCFLLLIHFIVTTTIVKKEQDLDLGLPEPGTMILESSPFVIQVAQDGEITVNPDIFPEVVASAGSGSDLNELKDRLRLIQYGHGNDVVVQLRVDEEVDYQRFVDVLNCLATQGIEKTAIVDLESDS
ncbi:MAG: biopolymer transporter ExbD [Akkermansiaceae bacterium]